MKTITLASWCLLALYAAILVGLLLFGRTGTSDNRMASGYVMLLFVPLGILAVINLLPFQFTRVMVLVLCIAPVVMGTLMLIATPIVSKVRQGIWAREDAAQENGSYYFRDKNLQKLAADIAVLDNQKLRTDLEQSEAELNKTGREQITLFDFAAKQGLNADPAKMVECFEILLKSGAKIDNGDPAHTPTHFRILEYSPSLLKWFLENGADAGAREARTQHPILFLAVCGENSEPARPLKMERVRMLLEHGADPNANVPKQDDLTIESSILMTAADMELWTICEMLLDYGADAGYRTPGGSTIADRVKYQLHQHHLWGKMPPEDLTRLAKRLNLPLTSETLQ
ncbi:hypothetical protein LZD49_26090 [Dyadobacter sp. CY261]|uniref:ankyrin repeat domain-containing protein n=1 Tax=Dyadobacter sp. CY261 TaxID=2907203 RepID=UPI001F3A7B64|nr:hypothetical protein [Dyadobacter sp. CY261]MCF0073979.1 hypothetical protein [Dyadobacter sp. CY261]